jgi:hypothetical protein
VPNYQEIDRDPQWHRWLSSPDSLTDRPRQLPLRRAGAIDEVTNAILSTLDRWFRIAAD